MQELMIPWLWDDKLDLESLIDWLHARPIRQYMEKQLAERLAILVGKQP